MPEEQAAYVIIRRIHVKHNTNTLFISGIRLCQLQHDRTGKLRFLKYCDSLFSLIFTIPLGYSISVRSESSAAAFVEESRPSVLAYSTIWIRIQNRRFTTSGMSGEEVDSFIKRPYLFIYVMPVIQAYLRECFEWLLRLQFDPPH